MRNTRYKRGFTIVELLLALAISAMLLVAVAVAFNASAMNYQENEAIFKTVNAARQALLRMTSQLRASLPLPNPGPSNECTLDTADGDNITYRYDSGQNVLYLITNSDGQQYVLCDNVASMSFSQTPTDDGLDCKSVQISMTVTHGNVQRTVSAAAVIRRNLN